MNNLIIIYHVFPQTIYCECIFNCFVLDQKCTTIPSSTIAKRTSTDKKTASSPSGIRNRYLERNIVLDLYTEACDTESIVVEKMI